MTSNNKSSKQSPFWHTVTMAMNIMCFCFSFCHRSCPVIALLPYGGHLFCVGPWLFFLLFYQCIIFIYFCIIKSETFYLSFIVFVNPNCVLTLLIMDSYYESWILPKKKKKHYWDYTLTSCHSLYSVNSIDFKEKLSVSLRKKPILNFGSIFNQLFWCKFTRGLNPIYLHLGTSSNL